ncbi:hypothetical protein SHJJP8921_001499 [Staphylococcus lugdunensis]|uniref:hypothetical protein n=1 Tax=Staphylococcus lugdunensis TaxID=28035 RepID=UPI001F4CAE72|nr:hypothetical protein [Staphylococcus lugdunensis]MCH8647234.1 hypothetical protein [Staphylococcus lugdunensis]
MKMFNWNIINETDYELKGNYLEKDIIILDQSTNRQIAYFKYNETQGTYIIDEKTNDVLPQIFDEDKKIVLYKNVAS